MTSLVHDRVRLISPTDDVIDPLQDALGYDNDDDDFILREDPELEKANWYAVLMGRYPWIVMIGVVVVIVSMGVVCWYFYPPTNIDFDNPTKGFDTRNTPISAAQSTQYKLLYESHLSVNLSGSMVDLSSLLQPAAKDTSKGGPDEHTESKKIRRKRNSAGKQCPSNYFGKGYSLIFASTSGSNLLTAEHLKAMCRIEDEYIAARLQNKCRRQSLASFTAALFAKKCLDISSEDVILLQETLQTASGCNNTSCDLKCPQKSQDCFNKAKTMLTEYSDLNFRKTCRDGKCFLTYTKMNLEDKADWKFFHRELEGRDIEQDGVALVAVNLEENDEQYQKYLLFEYYLIADVRFFILAMILVLVVMLVYLKSLALMVATVLNVAFSYLAAYFFYYFIFRQTFFPFMNLLALLVLIAVGADDVFIFYDAWVQARRELPHGSYEHWIAKTFNHAVISVIVTSFTTAGAFFSNIISSITTIKCFGLFAGICIMSNLLLMLTWTPSLIVIVEKLWDLFLKWLPRLASAWNRMCESCSKASGAIYDKYVPLVIEKGRFVWLFLLLGLGFAGIVIIFYKPGLQLPHSSDFQLFSDNMKLEKWDRDLKFKFAHQGPTPNIMVTFSWGVKCVDNRNVMNPDDNGRLEYDDQFDLSSDQSKIAISKFINNSRKYPYFNVEYMNGAFGLAIPLFDNEGHAKALIFNALTTLQFTFSYEEMNENYQKLHQFYEQQKTYMPPELKSMCFAASGQFHGFYDLQLAIANGTLWSIGFSLAIAAGILFLSTLNLILTLYSVLTITLAISATVGTIVLMGWELNILESIAVSMAAGLSVDFTIHYSVAYRFSQESTPKLRAREGFHRVGFAVAVAALTTFLAGAAVLPSHVIAYTKLGIFLMLVMSFSWVYATFFFQSLCCIIGPKGNFCQLPSPTKLCKKKTRHLHVGLHGHEQYNPAVHNDDDDTLLEPM